MTEKEESWLSYLAPIRDFNPIALGICFGLMLFFLRTLDSDIQIFPKMFLLLNAAILYFITIVFEFCRIEKRKG